MLSHLPRSSVFYILDRILEEYPDDFRAWLASGGEKVGP